MKPTAAATGLERLNPFVGVWATEGEMKTGPSAQPATFDATDAYEWLPGGHFLLHRFDADMPDGRIQGIEVIGYDGENDSYPMHSFDSRGTASVMQGRLETGTWTFIGDGIRFTGRFSEDGKVFEGRWESRPDDRAAWQPWMDVRLRKTE